MIVKYLDEIHVNRRQVLALGGSALAVLAASGLMAPPALASPKAAKAKLAELVGGKKAEKGRVAIILPPMTNDGKRVRIKVAVDSPMTEQDYVKSLHILAERNTVPEVASYHFGPLSGKAEMITRIRVAKSQTIIAAAEMSDGSVYMAKVRCKVARGAGGCG